LPLRFTEPPGIEFNAAAAAFLPLTLCLTLVLPLTVTELGPEPAGMLPTMPALLLLLMLLPVLPELLSWTSASANQVQMAHRQHAHAGERRWRCQCVGQGKGTNQGEGHSILCSGERGQGHAIPRPSMIWSTSLRLRLTSALSGLARPVPALFLEAWSIERGVQPQQEDK
jgi:hypothetical protein